MQPAQKEISKQGVDNSSKWVLGLGYTSQLYMHFENAYLSANGGSKSDIKAYYNGSPKLHLGYQYSAPNDYGFALGGASDFTRKFASGTDTTNGVTTQLAGDSQIQSFYLYFDWMYRFVNFYVIVGGNYAIHNYTSPSFSGTTEIKNGVGPRFGFGYYFTENIAAEFVLFDYAAISLRTVQSNGTIDNFGSSSVALGTMQLKYLF